MCDVCAQPVGEVFYDFDGFVWVRYADGELAGPYSSVKEAVADA
jgi:hypothetical protein